MLLQLQKEFYLSSLKQTINISDLLCEKKNVRLSFNITKYIKNSQLKVIQVPYIEELRITVIFKFIRERVNIDEYLPTFKKELTVPLENKLTILVVLAYYVYLNNECINGVYFLNNFSLA